MLEAGKYGNTEFGYLLRWLQEIGDHDGCHSGRMSSPHAIVRILQGPAGPRCDLKAPSCHEETVRVRLALLDIVAGHDGREQVQKACFLEVIEGSLPVRRRRYSGRDVMPTKFPEQLAGTLLDRNGLRASCGK